MGRPINKKYFANTNYQDFGTGNVGGESVASVTIAAPIAASLAAGTTTVTFSGPQLVNGQAATGTAVIDGNGDLTGITITFAGSGYTSIPTISVVDSDNNETLSLTTGSGGVTVALTSGASARQNSIKCEAQIGAGSEVLTGDVIKQQSARRYKVKTSDGTAFCKLVTTTDNSLGANEMSIMATDSAGGTYLVSKLTAHKAVLVPVANTHGGTSSAGAQFASGTTAKWTFGSAVLNTTVTIANQ
jgi:hypothetical protein